MINRREFVTTGLAAIAATGSDRALGFASVQPAFSLELLFKGQFIYITEKGSLYAACLKNDDRTLTHHGLVYVPQDALDTSRAVPPSVDQVGDGAKSWKGWHLEGQVQLEILNSRRLRLPPSGSSGTLPRTSVPWPVPLDDDTKWNDRIYIPQLAQISPRCAVKRNWRAECHSYWMLDAAKLRPRKPCKPADVVSVWVWKNKGSQPTHLSAVTDLVSYPLFTFGVETKLALRIGKIIIPIIVRGRVEIPVLCAPSRTNPPSRAAYTSMMRIGHFESVYRILDGANYATMHYFAASEAEGNVKGTPCNPVFSARDDDIFCPGGEPPPVP
jgi:hypothetical protein